jgi:CheY-like chemotaxis protein
MKYALILEKNSELCNNTAAVLSSMGYLTTPVFNQKKALYAARLIQFDLIVTCTSLIPGDRRSLTGELKRCLPDATILLLADPGSTLPAEGKLDGVSAILYRPLTEEAVRSIVDPEQPPSAQQIAERRREYIF